MTRFLENPLPAIVIGVGLMSVLLIAYLQTRRPLVMAGLLTLLLLTVAAVFVERIVVTEKEKVEAVVYGIAAAAEKNDMPGVLGHLAPGASRIRRIVRRHMPDSKVERVRILSKLVIKIDNATEPPTASVECNVFVSGKWGRDRMSVAQRSDVVCLLVKPDDRWLIREVEGIEVR